MFLLTVGSEAANKIVEERPEILPWFLGFLVAMVLLNIIMGKIGCRRTKNQQMNQIKTINPPEDK